MQFTPVTLKRIIIKGITDYSKTTLAILSSHNTTYGTPANPERDVKGEAADAAEIIDDIMAVPILGYDKWLARGLRSYHLRDINKYVQAFNGIQIESYTE